MKLILFLILSLSPVLSFAQTYEATISSTALVSESINIYSINPFDKCNNLSITSQSISCSDYGDYIELNVPFSVDASVTGGGSFDLSFAVNPSPISGEEFLTSDFYMEHNGSQISNTDTFSFSDNDTDNFNLLMNIHLFGSNAKNYFTGEVQIDLTIP